MRRIPFFLIMCALLVIIGALFVFSSRRTATDNPDAVQRPTEEEERSITSPRSLCDTMSGKDRDACVAVKEVQEAAINARAPEACGGIADADVRDTCIAQIFEFEAVEKDDVALCTDAPNASLCRGTYYFHKAFREKNSAVCAEIAEAEDAQRCREILERSDIPTDAPDPYAFPSL